MAAERDKRLLTVAAADPPELARFLQARLGLAAAAAQELVAQGAVRVGPNRAVRPTQPLPRGARVTVFLPTDTSHAAAPPGLQVVMQDAEMMVVEKPAGLDTQPGRRGGPSLTALLPPDVSLLHRLDAEASGLLLAARTPRAAAALQQALGRGAIHRAYVAVVAGAPADSGRIELRIGPRAASDPRSPLRQCYPPDSPHGQPATTWFQVLCRSGSGEAARALLLVQLGSGRTHQIRVHLAALGTPLCGDASYGGPPAARLCLHAALLRFPHPRTARPCQLISLPPPEFVAPAELEFIRPYLARREALATAFAAMEASRPPDAQERADGADEPDEQAPPAQLSSLA